MAGGGGEVLLRLLGEFRISERGRVCVWGGGGGGEF